MTAEYRVTTGGGAHTVAVISDGSDTHGEPRVAVRTGLLRTAALLRERTGIEATAVLVSAKNCDELIAELRALARDISGVYLIHTDPERGRAAQTALRATLPVITDRQTLAVAAVAAMLNALARADLAPAAGRAVIVGAERDRLVAALAVIAGIGQISSWSLDDAHNFPLHVLTRRATVVIDLLGSAAHPRLTDTPDPPPHVVSVDDPTVALVALPSLLEAAVMTGQSPDLTACLDCAHALAARTPPTRTLTVLSGTRPGAVTRDIADMSSSATHQLRRHRLRT